MEVCTVDATLCAISERINGHRSLRQERLSANRWRAALYTIGQAASISMQPSPWRVGTAPPETSLLSVPTVLLRAGASMVRLTQASPNIYALNTDPAFVLKGLYGVLYTHF